jgi:hypothetical protein
MDVQKQLEAVSTVSPTDPAVLRSARAALVAALVDDAPRTPDVGDLLPQDSNGTDPAALTTTGHDERIGRRPRWRGRARALSLLGGAAAVLVALVLVVGQPITVGHNPTAVRPPRIGAAAELRLIATNAATQAVPSLAVDQLLVSQTHLSILAHVSGNGSPPVSAQATVDLSVKKWSNDTGQSCSAITADPAQFPSSADQSAWHDLGLRDSPATQPVTGCSEENGDGVGGVGATAPDAITGNGGVIDVSQLPADPASLAHDLEMGSTGIPALDNLSRGPIQSIAFERAAVILIGPTTGASAAFSSALFQALSLLPGVQGLGAVTTHNGDAGQGFSYGETTIIVDPTTGTLLEARNIEDSASITSLATQYLGTGPMEVGSYGATIQWIDPVGAPSVVAVAALPADVPLEIFATVRPGVSQGDVLALQSQMNATIGRAEGGESYVAAGVQGSDSPSVESFGFSGPTPQFHDYLNTLRASGLFSSVDVI